jgi:hypothetical protein
VWLGKSVSLTNGTGFSQATLASGMQKGGEILVAWLKPLPGQIGLQTELQVDAHTRDAHSALN